MRLRVSKCFNAIITSSTGTNKGKTFRIPSSQTLIMKIAVLAESLLTNKMVKLQPGVIENFPWQTSRIGRTNFRTWREGGEVGGRESKRWVSIWHRFGMKTEGWHYLKMKSRHPRSDQLVHIIALSLDKLRGFAGSSSSTISYSSTSMIIFKLPLMVPVPFRFLRSLLTLPSTPLSNDFRMKQNVKPSPVIIIHFAVRVSFCLFVWLKI